MVTVLSVRICAMIRGSKGEKGHIYETGKFRGMLAPLAYDGCPEDAYREGGSNGDIDAILGPIKRGILQFVGFDVPAPQIHFVPVRSSNAQRETLLSDYSRNFPGRTNQSLRMLRMRGPQKSN